MTRKQKGKQLFKFELILGSDALDVRISISPKAMLFASGILSGIIAILKTIGITLISKGT